MKKVESARKGNSETCKAWKTFLDAQRIYEESVTEGTIQRNNKFRGTYSSSLSKKEYYANIPTVAR